MWFDVWFFHKMERPFEKFVVDFAALQHRLR
jgi:hypothetical protein